MTSFKLSVFVLGLVGIVALSGCGTIHGAGQDLESAGRAVQKAVH